MRSVFRTCLRYARQTKSAAFVSLWFNTFQGLCVTPNFIKVALVDKADAVGTATGIFKLDIAAMDRYPSVLVRFQQVLLPELA